ncbi:fungal-specific transcription factor domain-containing protein [Dactylonectria macrodidyma]|uniref:Fungal-specific transcription factor domain-containing protein n=1 Tax=Dactylonectria macrodidyma TaxID=307937 RepID=A0A9P9EY33_9HYPO|nr:fungal-specific transcription factor domain-containing protein [Dactylonectria macrodidyma]
MSAATEESGHAGPVSRLACTPCRSRKVKCDHEAPLCGNCFRNGRDCVWPQRRPNTSRRTQSTYKDLTRRLAQMENLVQEISHRFGSQHSPQSLTKFSSHGDSDSLSVTHPATREPGPSATGGLDTVFPGSMTQASAGSEGACSMFSSKGMRKINSLVGDESFTNLLTRLKTQPFHQTRDIFGLDPDYSMPPMEAVSSCVDDYLKTLNHDVQLFQEDEVRFLLQSYFQHGEGLQPGSLMALYMIMAHATKKLKFTERPEEYERFLAMAMKQIPAVLLKVPTPLEIGALLSMVLYFVFIGENQTAITLLGLVVQPILLAGYHCSGPGQNLSQAEALHRRRLFWQAYIIDHDLMLRIRKPPLISDEFLVGLPDEHPSDGYGVFYSTTNVSFNYFYQQVRLAKIQGRIYTLLCNNAASISPSLLESRISELDRELEKWRESIPELIRPEAGITDFDYHRLMCLTTLHFTYFQLIAAIHCAAFRIATIQDEEGSGSVLPSVALCVGASRAALSLLTYHEAPHPFAIYLLYQVSWSVDILFISILQNRDSSRSFRDLCLIQSIVSFFERYDPNYLNMFSYHFIKGLEEIASRVVRPQSLVDQFSTSFALGSLEPQMSMQGSGQMQPAQVAPESLALGPDDSLWPLENTSSWFPNLPVGYVQLDFGSEFWEEMEW